MEIKSFQIQCKEVSRKFKGFIREHRFLGQVWELNLQQLLEGVQELCREKVTEKWSPK